MLNTWRPFPHCRPDLFRFYSWAVLIAPSVSSEEEATPLTEERAVCRSFSSVKHTTSTSGPVLHCSSPRLAIDYCGASDFNGGFTMHTMPYLVRLTVYPPIDKPF